MVLFLFVVMLLNLGREKATPYFMRFQQATSLMLVLLFFFGIFLIMINGSGELHQPLSKFSAGNVYALGEALFTKFLLPFEVASLLLLVALIGTVYLGKRKIL
jgi:NADH-quinone oxidoreductase subunit J